MSASSPMPVPRAKTAVLRRPACVSLRCRSGGMDWRVTGLLWSGFLFGSCLGQFGSILASVWVPSGVHWVEITGRRGRGNALHVLSRICRSVVVMPVGPPDCSGVVMGRMVVLHTGG